MPRASRDTPRRVAPPQPPHRPGPGRLIGLASARLRDRLAAGLAAAGVTPNLLTSAGFLLTVCAAACLLRGAGQVLPGSAVPTAPRGWWPLAAGGFLFLALAMDVLDGAVARVGRLQSPFGAILDSTLDRCSDIAVFAGCILYFARSANLTGVALSILALTAALLVSYIKARAENLIPACGVGTWQRGERCAALLAATLMGHVPAALWLLATLPFGTVICRVRHAWLVTQGRSVSEPRGLARLLQPWRHPRGSLGYDLFALTMLLFLFIAPRLHPALAGQADPFGPWLAGR